MRPSHPWVLMLFLSLLPSLATLAGAQGGTTIFADGFETGDFSNWTTAVIDEIGPMVTIVSPTTVIFDEPSPPIRILWRDVGAGLDLASFVLRLDGVDQTSTCVATASGADCTVAPLTSGAHVVEVEIADLVGNATATNRLFDVFLGPGPHTLVRPVLVDTTINELDPDVPGGDALVLTVGGTDVARALVRADAEAMALVAGFNLTRAELVLTVDTNAGGWGGGTDVGIHPVLLAAWSEATATWTCPEAVGGSCDAAWDGGIFDDPTDAIPHDDATAGTVVFDVLDDVEAVQRGAEDLGWLVKKADETNPGGVTYSAREGATPPRLELVFVAPPAPGDDVDPPSIVFTEPTVPIFRDVSSLEVVVGYEDAGSGVDLDSLVVTYDGVDRTDQCQLGVGFATCRFAASSSAGSAQRHTLRASIDDTNGNAASTELMIGVIFGDDDLSPPLLNVTSPAGDVLVNTPTITFEGTAVDDGSIARLSVNGIGHPLAVDDSFQVVVPLVPGDNVVEVLARDESGKVSTVQRTVTFDPTLPTLVIESPGPGLVTNAPTIRVEGRVFDVNGITEVTVAGVPAAVTDGQWSADVPLLDGVNVVVVQAIDGAGNPVTASVDVTRFAVPTLTITSPQDLELVGSTVTVEGTVDPPSASVSVNGQPATVGGGSFVATSVPVGPGTDLLTAVATDGAGHVATATVTVVRDVGGPRLAVAEPAEGAEVFETPIAVVGQVTDLDIPAVGGAPLAVTVDGVPATVAHGAFVLEGVDLVAGDNVLTVEATDQAGNVTQVIRTVRLSAATAPRLRIVSGDRQTAEIGAALPAPLVVEAVDAVGQPVPNVPVLFRMRSDGSLDGGRRQVAVLTDGSGQASTGLTLGMRAGPGRQRVEVSAAGFGTPVVMTATATAGAPAMIVIDAGSEQVGIAGQRLPQPLVASVVDAGFNRLVGVDVRFAVVAGDGTLVSPADGDPAEATVTTDAAGNATVGFRLGSELGPAAHVVEATLPAGPSAPFASFTATAEVAGDPAATAISGLVFDNSDEPVPGATLEIAGTALSTVAGPDGSFRLTGVPPGMVTLLVDASTVTRPGTWPDLAFRVHAIPGVDNALGRPIHVLPLDLANAVNVDETTGATLTLPEVPGFALDIAPGSVTFPSGATSGAVSVTVVHGDKVPMVPNFGQQPRFVVTIQPSGAHFDPPARLTLPNVDGLAPGATTELYSFDHDRFRFVAIGEGVVSDDGLRIQSIPGAGVVEAGWHCGSNPSGSGTPHDCPTCKRCVNNRCANDDGDTPPQAAPDDCKRQVCRGGSVRDEPDTSEMPQQTPGDCLRKECTADNGGSTRDVADTGDPPGGMMCCGTDGSTMTPDIYDPMAQCCRPSPQEVFAKHPMPEDWQTRCPNRVAHPGHMPGANGCGAADGFNVPDDPNPGCGGFTGPCDNHDRCYDTCRNDKGGCDGTFGNEMRQVCMDTCSNFIARNFCIGNANDYERAVRWFGGGAYDSAQQNACDCCP